MKTLDKSKPYAQVFGASDTTAYVQDGLHFDGNGNLIQAEAVEPVQEDAPGTLLLSMSVDKIKAELPGMVLGALRSAREAEKAGAARVTLLAAIDAEIASRDQLATQMGS